MHLFKSRGNDHLMSYFPLIYHYGTNTNTYIAFNIFSWRILIISYKILIITVISNEKTNELTIYAILCRNVAVFYQQNLASLFQVQVKLKIRRNSKLNFLSRCFIASDSYVKTQWLYVIVSSNDILHLRDNVHLLKYYPVKVSQNCFCSLNCSNQTVTQVSKSLFALDK